MRLKPPLFFFLLLILATCGPANETASYNLPTTAGGRLCSHECVQAQDYCRLDCNIHQRQCTDVVQSQALKDYDAYTRDQFDHHQPIKLLPSDFERQTNCTDTHKDCEAECAHGYESCFEECGGHVNVKSSCEFLCF